MGGGYDFNPNKRNSAFYERATTDHYWNTTRDSRFQFNNRSSNFHWRTSRGVTFRGDQTTWNASRQKPRSQTAKSRFVAVNPPRSFISKPPMNLFVTIPNFSGRPPPDVFVFRNPPAKSVKFTTSAPSSVFHSSSSCLPANKEIGASLSKSYEAEKNDDIQYLYTVQTKGEEHVEVVDLAEDAKGPSCPDKFGASDRLLASNSIASSDVEMRGNDSTIPKISEKVPSTEKKSAAQHKGRKRKKSSEDLLCDICELEYTWVKMKGEDIFKARCGHMFCQQCLKQLDPYKCPECNLYLQKLFKVFY